MALIARNVDTGTVVADTLLAHGHSVRVIVRDAAKGV